MNVLSLFDGMSCGMLALDRLSIKVDKYYASEIDKYAMQVSAANYPEIIQVGDITKLDLSTLPKIDLVMGGSPCQGFSFAGKQLGMEDTPEEFTENLVKVFREVKRVLRDDGTVWLNLGDSYSSGGRTTKTNQSLRGDKDYGVTRPKPSEGIKPKDLIGIPWRVAFALQQDGWYLRQDIIWHKPNPMPESVKDRCTKAHEYIFLLSKNVKYYFDNEAIKEDAKYPQGPNSPQSIKKGKGEFGMDTRGGLSKIGALAKKNKRSVWTITTKPFKGAHFATFPKDLIEPCVLAGCPEGGTVLDPFGGSGTTGIVAAQHNRNAVLLELNQEYIDLAKDRINKELGMMVNLKCEKEKI
jgi:site-specific DNA-methyltransferase (adenine-specific)